MDDGASHMANYSAKHRHRSILALCYELFDKQLFDANFLLVTGWLRCS